MYSRGCFENKLYSQNLQHGDFFIANTSNKDSKPVKYEICQVSDDVVEEMNKKKGRKSTESLTKTQTNILKNYLKKISHSKASDLESFEKQELAETLKRFYIAVRKSDGNLYKLTASRSIKYWLALFF